MSQEMPAFLVNFLAEAMAWAEKAPEAAGGGVSCFLNKIAVVVEGETVGHLVNEDPEWVYWPLP